MGHVTLNDMLTDNGMKMESPSNQSIFRTKDWNVAALCLSKNVKLLTVERNGPCFFIFGDAFKASALAEAFYRGDVEVNVRVFTDSQRRVKDLIHQTNGNEKWNLLSTSNDE